ncbi:MAG: hypothetical protein WA771_05235 [Chthoniobacterales bacterium]
MNLDAAKFEKLGKFYLGRSWDVESGEAVDEPLLYDAKDLVTHAVCVGMTGSGKTGLCVGLLEEAAIDGIPALVIDPKGDLTNLALQFPELSAAEFAPWVNGDAAAVAQKWKDGLGEWGQDGERVRRLRDAAEVRIYTPGSQAGTPLSILAAFDPPAQSVRDDAETFADAIQTAATSLLGLVGIKSDGGRSRELTLVAAILQHEWRAGRGVPLPDLVRLVQKPPFAKVGVLDVDGFYPEKDRFDLVLALNNFLASPGFSGWTQGEPLDVASLLHTPEGKPRLAVLSIAHLSEAERMFFVSLLLNAVVAWVRTQGGTTSLRALLYLDEVFGYLPPVADPPSKRPLLTLLKQARAQGLGVVLATQNPADLDYKALSNAGTWFVGKLQTERDRDRLMEGLRSIEGDERLPAMLASLGSRRFLLNNVHEDGPVVFETRWALSYLAGPLTREQIRVLAGADRPERSEKSPALSAGGGRQPVIEGVDQVCERAGAGAELGARLLVVATVRYRDRKLDVDISQDGAWVLPVPGGMEGLDWTEAKEVRLEEFAEAIPGGASFGEVTGEGRQSANYREWKREAKERVVENCTLALLSCEAVGVAAEPGESEGEFRVRLAHALREERDERIEELRAKFEKARGSLETKIERARDAVEREEAQVGQARMQAALSFGSTLLSAFLGRKAVSRSTLGRATTAARGVGRSFKEAGEADRAREKLVELEAEVGELAMAFEGELAEMEVKCDPLTVELKKIEVGALKTGTSVRRVALAWIVLV